MLNVNCKENEFEDEGTVTNESLLVEARELMNDQLWDLALVKFGEMDTIFRNERANVIYLASAHAGRCGVNMIDILNGAGNMGTSNPLQFMLSIMRGSTVTQMGSCITAESIIDNNASADPLLRTDDENLIFTLILIGKIGSILSARTDPDGDGVSNLAHNESCPINPLAGAEVRQLATGLTKLLETIPQLSDSSAAGGIDTDLLSICTTLEGFNPAFNFCNITDPAAFTPNHIRAIRTMIQEGDTFGLSTCTAAPPSLGNCVCP